MKIFQKIIHKKLRQKRLTCLRQEIEKNQEILHVSRQRQSLLSFQTVAWSEYARREQLDAGSVLCRYGGLVQAYQEGFRQLKDHERWYLSSPQNQSREEARVLHAYQEKAQDALSALSGWFEKVRQEIALLEEQT